MVSKSSTNCETKTSSNHCWSTPSSDFGPLSHNPRWRLPFCLQPCSGSIGVVDLQRSLTTSHQSIRQPHSHTRLLATQNRQRRTRSNSRMAALRSRLHDFSTPIIYYLSPTFLFFPELRNPDSSTLPRSSNPRMGL